MAPLGLPSSVVVGEFTNCVQCPVSTPEPVCLPSLAMIPPSPLADVMKKTLSYLDGKSLARLERVSTQMREAAGEKSVWRTVLRGDFALTRSER